MFVLFYLFYLYHAWFSGLLSRLTSGGGRWKDRLSKKSTQGSGYKVTATSRRVIRMAPRENRPLQRQKRNPMKKTVPAHTRSGDQTSPHRLVDGYPVHRKAHEPTVDQAAHRGTHARPQQGPSHLGPRKPEDRREQRDGPSMSDRHNPPVGEAASGRNPWRWFWVLPCGVTDSAGNLASLQIRPFAKLPRLWSYHSILERS